MLLIMMILLSVSVSLFVVEKDAVNYMVVKVLGGIIEIAEVNNRTFVYNKYYNTRLLSNIDHSFRGPPKYKVKYIK